MSSESQTLNDSGDHPVLQEYPLQSQLLYLIPARAQKGLSTFDIEFTCIDTDGHYIAIGTNIGIVYVFDRITNNLKRLRNDHKDAITCVKILISLECLVVFGCKSGAVFVFKIPFDSEEEFEKFSVEGLHKAPIASLEWVKNGIKFFSGDESGVVVCTEIDHFEHQSRSRVLLNDQSKIVQLSYSRLHLVVSTLFRSIIYSCEDGSITKIGQKERKCYGPFGAIIFQANHSSDNIVFASRPGQRLWKSDNSGIIHETMIFKNALSVPHPVIKLLNDAQGNNNFPDFQFGKLSRFNDRYILVSSDSAIILIDSDQKSVLASSPKLDPIVDVSTCNNEIFILRGLRHLVRISDFPDPYPCEKVPEEPSLMEDILIPLKGLTTFVKERSDSLAAQTENTIFDWLKKKRSSSSPTVISNIENEGNQNQLSNSQNLPEVVKLQPEDNIPVVIENPTLQPLIDVPKIEISAAFDSTDDIVYKPKKKHKKKVRFRSVSPKKKDRKSLSSDSEVTNRAESDSLKQNVESTKVPSDSVKNSSTSDIIMPNLNETDSSGSKAEDSSSHTDSSNDKNDNSNLESKDNNLKTLSDTDMEKSVNEKFISGGINTEDSTKDAIDSLNTDFDNNSTSDEQLIDNPSSNLNDTHETVIDPDDIYSSYNSLQNNLHDSNLNVQSTYTHLPSKEDISEQCEEMQNSELPKYGGDWLEYKAPELLADLAVSNDHIFCVDVRNQVYYSNYPVLGLQWKKINQPAEKIAVSPSEEIFWALYRGTIYAALQKAPTKWRDVDWISAARDVISMSVEDDCGWYVTSDGNLTLMPNLTSSKPFDYPKSIKLDPEGLNIVQVSAWNNTVWLLTSSGCVQSFDYKKAKSGFKLKKIELNGVSVIDGTFLGVQHTGWLIDCNGVIRFKIGITTDSSEGIGKPWEVEASKYFIRSNPNLPKAVLKALNNESFTNLIRGKQHICLSTSNSGIWFCKTMENVLYSNKKTIIGHKWELVVPAGAASATKWKHLSASGISCTQGSIWCMDSTNELFCLCLSTNMLISVELPKASEVLCLIPTLHSLWLLFADGNIFSRRGITPNCPEGISWQLMNLNQLGQEKLIDISCSYDVAWACTNQGRVLIRLGSLCPSYQRKLAQAWIPISIESDEVSSPIMDKLSAIGKKFPLPLVQTSRTDFSFSKIYVGPLGYPVWALDDRGNVFVRESVTPNMPIGKKWTLVPELLAKSLCISKNAVWLLKQSGKIFRRFGISEKNPCGDYWKQIPGIMDNISVTEDDDLWSLKDERMYQHSSYALNFNSSNTVNKLPARSISEEDWEDIMAETSD
ncbi:hypothetical protein TNIN_371451 [Trichonephila inaurata madagascariensis]|uniref:HPS5-like beta-propeller domain-containing protein n=1 Tax=Trichonephila inaurata madagascariensis TaxID=2747483 RepID=A0A8X7C3Q0_9ARAC|nr:hypothetical protein TNIN_371451 [Trichonephila inaurata madagascariensis]